MENSILLNVGFGLLVLSIALVRVFCGYAPKLGLLDIPNDRSSHQSVTPRGAGVVFIALWLTCLLLGFVYRWFSLKTVLLFLPSTLLIAMLGFWDDFQGLTAKKRLIIQGLIALYCVMQLEGVPALRLFSGTAYPLGIMGIVLGILGLVWSTNLFNFMDGLDGIAAIEALFVFGAGGLLFWMTGEKEIALLVFALNLSVAGFLVWNRPKARVFMGSVGSYCLGFLVGLFALVGDLWYNIPVTLWIILYGVFWFDATITLIRRFVKRENLAMAHRDHAFHRLQKVGFTHGQVLSGVIILNSLLTGIAITLSFYPHFIKAGILVTIAILASVYCVIERLNPMLGGK